MDSDTKKEKRRIRRRNHYAANKTRILEKERQKRHEESNILHQRRLAAKKHKREQETPEQREYRLEYLKQYRKKPNKRERHAVLSLEWYHHNKYGHHAFIRYRGNAKRRKIEFSLQEEYVCMLLNQACTYCGTLISNGIDRQNNTKGYTPENCVPCCWRCNHMKGTDTIYDFLSHVKTIHKHCIC